MSNISLTVISVKISRFTEKKKKKKWNCSIIDAKLRKSAQ